MVMGCSDPNGRNASDETPISHLPGFDVAHASAKPNHDLAAVEIRIVDEAGEGFEVVIGPEECLVLIVQLCESLAGLLKAGPEQRIEAAQLLIHTAREAVGVMDGDLAAALGVSPSLISAWASGTRALSEERLRALRRHVRNLLRASRS
jgi:Helix-turn-helix